MITKVEHLLVTRDEAGKMLAVTSKIEGKTQYEVYATQFADLETMQDLLNGKDNEKKV